VETTKLSSKGQIILPKSVREAHRWQPGTEFIVEDRPEGVLLRPAKPFQPTRLLEVIGIAGYSGPAKTLEEMEEAIAQGALERHARGRY
jgi:AbrB family looped-hinge helix DNA binding protein